MDDIKKFRIKYDNNMLKCIIERDKCTINSEYNKLSRDTIINYTCNCGIKTYKMFRYVYEHGGYCKQCLKSMYNNKVKDTNLKKFGKEYASQNTEIKEKVKKTFQTKYNVDYALQSSEIKEKIKLTNISKYGVKNPFQSDEIKNKIKETCMSKYGVENPMKTDSIKEKLKCTNLQNHGVEHSMQSESVRNKSKETCIKKYGVNSPLKSDIILNKVIATNIEKYGVKCTLHTPENNHKIKNNWLIKYGVEYPMQNVEIQQKVQRNSKKFKEYKMPSGNIRKVQGYEPFALDELINTYTEEDILTNRKDVGKIMYIYQNKERYYFPDIKISSENKYIEVKSTWTYSIDKDIIYAKMMACKEQGYNYEIWIYDKKKQKQIL